MLIWADSSSAGLQALKAPAADLFLIIYELLLL